MAAMPVCLSVCLQERAAEDLAAAQAKLAAIQAQLDEASAAAEPARPSKRLQSKRAGGCPAR
jgi:hypothetical protein